MEIRVCDFCSPLKKALISEADESELLDRELLNGFLKPGNDICIECAKQIVSVLNKAIEKWESDNFKREPIFDMKEEKK
jgi:hypothetical protein